MKRLREPDLIVTAVVAPTNVREPPCGLPREIWMKEVFTSNNGFLMTKSGRLVPDNNGSYLDVRALRLTCRWFAHHFHMSEDTYDGFWPAVEAYIRRGDAPALYKLDWPTHPRCSIQRGYNEGKHANYSFGRAGREAVRQNDAAMLSLLILHGGEWWTDWLVEALILKHTQIMRMLMYVVAPTHKERKSEELHWHESLLLVAIRHNNFEVVKFLDTQQKPLRVGWLAMSVAKDLDISPVLMWFLRSRRTATMNREKREEEARRAAADADQ